MDLVSVAWAPVGNASLRQTRVVLTPAPLQSQGLDLASHILLRNVAKETLVRLDQLSTHGVANAGPRGLTLEWCAAVSGSLCCTPTALHESLMYDFCILQQDKLQRTIAQRLQSSVPVCAEHDPASRSKEIGQFVAMFVDYLKASLVTTKRCDFALGDIKVNKGRS